MATAPSGPRWVGFDMDECLGSFMPLWPFCDKIHEYVDMGENVNAYLSAIAKRLAFSDRVWLLRPDLDPLLAALVQAKQTGKITGCFILTNNGSEYITEVVRKMLNYRAQALISGTTSTLNSSFNLFSIFWTRKSPCRKKHGIFVKSIKCIQDCLATVGLPTINRINDLLFYDDSDHALAKEIPHYSKVKAYNHYTPVNLVFLEIKGVMQRFGIDQRTLDSIFKFAEALEDKDLKENRELIPRPPSSSEKHEYSLVREFAHFLQGSPMGKSKGKTKGTKDTKGIRSTTRKNSPRYKSKTRRSGAKN
jgi:hypothetical protein